MPDGGNEDGGLEGIKKRPVLRLPTSANTGKPEKTKDSKQRRDEMRRAREHEVRIQFEQKGIRIGFGVFLEWKTKGVLRREYVTIDDFRTSFTNSNQKVGVEISFDDGKSEEYVQFRNILKVSPVR